MLSVNRIFQHAKVVKIKYRYMCILYMLNMCKDMRVVLCGTDDEK